MENNVHAPWMTTPATRAVVEALTADDADVRFVGGCVRDALLDRESDDIDVGTPDPPERVLALLENAGIETRTVPRGIEHGTVTALADGEKYEITTLRRDERTDGRHAEVAFTDDWREDAARRDFTINSMSAAPDGALFDYFGGQEDLSAGRVRFVGDPATRIAEDHLRLLRFFRFYAWYGEGEPDAAALTACKDAAHTIPLFSSDKINAVPRLSFERAQKELLKLLEAPDPSSSVRAMWASGVLARLLPETQRTEPLARLVAIESQVAQPDLIRRLAALNLDTHEDNAERRVDTRLLAGVWLQTGVDAGRLFSIASEATALPASLDRRVQRSRIYQSGKERFRDAVLLAWARDTENEIAWRAMLETIEQWEAPTFPLTGADVLARGVPEGPEVGRLLKAAEDWWIDRDFTPDRAALLDRLDGLVTESRRES
ncbi:MAG: CCA tRNA nucleotidyltransferase [Rhodospirillales bacterium]|nr:CCA tRNA nucleotidyltransferase [Rhodospirillales bacterium]